MEKIESQHIEGNVEEGKDVKPSLEETTVEEFDHHRSKLLNRRLDLRILPLCCWLYLLNFLDRGNIGNARVLNQETGDDLLHKTGMTTLRLLIGVFEAGFFPGIVYLITIWYRHNERAVRIAYVIAFCNLAGAFGGAIAYGMGTINGAAGVEGFRWLFIVEGIITILSVLPTLFILPDYPARAKFLSAEEKSFAEDRVKNRGGGWSRQHATRKEILETFFSPRMLAHYFAYVANVVTQGSFTFFAPTIVSGLGYQSIHAQLMTVPPWVVGFVVAIALSYSADRFEARGLHITVMSTIGGLGWLTAGLLPPTAYVKRYGCLCLAAAGAFPLAPSMTNWVTCNTPSLLTIPFAIALHNSCAGIGQIISQWIWRVDEAKQGYPTGNFVCAACDFLVAIIALSLRLYYARMNRKGVKDARGETRIWAY
ncbi:hypothetical protein Daesc_004805 [Daldinia eschscholtzii]|uniref:MFS transporter n=1 Tax=Daldinia eschscholtzii TaxID=292717 RepID=A0AAX6MQQ3_9PEZI